MISLRDVSWKVAERYLLKHITLNINSGKLHLIIGPNGAGKSTLVKIMSGQLDDFEGRLQFGDKSIKEYSLAALARIRAVLSQNINLSFPLKVKEVVMMGRYPHFEGQPEGRDHKACNEAMQLFEVSDLSERDYTTLSGGEKQRVQFARVLSQIWYKVENKTRYLLLDEPLTFLDIHYQHVFMQQLRSLLTEDIVVIAVVHDLNIGSKYGDNIILLDKGRLICAGIPKEVFTPFNIEAVYKMKPNIYMVDDKPYLIF